MDSWGIIALVAFQLIIAVPVLVIAFLVDWAMKYWYAVQAVLRF